MSDPIVLTITDTARRKMLSYEKSGLEVLFSHASIGAGNYQHSKDTAAMAMAWGDFPILQCYVDKKNYCLSLLVMGRVDTEKTVSEIGLYDREGNLFAVASKPAGYYFKTQAGVYFTFSLSVTLDQQILGKKIKLGFSPQDQMLAALMALHGQQNNPHPQYIKFMREVIAAHLLESDPHTQYVMKANAEQAIRQYIDTVNRLLKLFISLLGYACFTGAQQAGSNNVIALEKFTGSLLNNYPIFINPEGGHEAWSIGREMKQFHASVFNRSGTSRVGYAGVLNWLVLPPETESPAVQIVMPELIDSGVVGSGGSMEAKRAAGSAVDYSQCVFLMCPEGAHEGWTVGRAADRFTASIFNRSGTSRVGYGGKVSYAVFEKKAGAVPLAYPGLLMSGVANGSNFSILRPDGMNWDFRDPNYVLQINPEGGHEAWTISRAEDRFNINVFHRSGTSRVGYGGNVNWAIFMKNSL